MSPLERMPFNYNVSVIRDTENLDPEALDPVTEQFLLGIRVSAFGGDTVDRNISEDEFSDNVFSRESTPDFIVLNNVVPVNNVDDDAFSRESTPDFLVLNNVVPVNNVDDDAFSRESTPEFFVLNNVVPVNMLEPAMNIQQEQQQQQEQNTSYHEFDDDVFSLQSTSDFIMLDENEVTMMNEVAENDVQQQEEQQEHSESDSIFYADTIRNEDASNNSRSRSRSSNSSSSEEEEEEELYDPDVDKTTENYLVRRIKEKKKFYSKLQKIVAKYRKKELEFLQLQLEIVRRKRRNYNSRIRDLKYLLHPNIPHRHRDFCFECGRKYWLQRIRRWQKCHDCELWVCPPCIPIHAAIHE